MSGSSTHRISAHAEVADALLYLLFSAIFTTLKGVGVVYLSTMKKLNCDLTIEDIKQLCTISDGGCWLWLFRPSHKYGTITFFKKRFYIHRHTYTMANGPIPEGLEIDHLCRERRCCNPEHLQAVTGSTNNSRSESLSARNARKTHCKRGHELSGSNLYVRRGNRGCRTCINAAKRTPEYMEKRRASRAKRWELEKARKRELRRLRKLISVP